MIKKKIFWLKTGNFNGLLDDGGTLNMLTLLGELRKRGCDSLVHSIRGPADDSVITKYSQMARSWPRESDVVRKESTLSFVTKRIPVNVKFLFKEDAITLFKERDERRFREAVERVKEEIQEERPDAIITTQEDIFALLPASKAGVPHFHVFSSDTFKYNHTYNLYRKEFIAALASARVVTHNPFFVKDIMRIWRKKAYVLPAIIDYRQYIAEKRVGRYITFINYCPVKGSVIFWNIARKMTHKEFLITNRDGRFKNEDGLSNVTCVGREGDMKNIYGATRILLVPSLWEESYARVITEAMANGIPVIATRIGGNSYILKKTGFLADVNMRDRKKKDYFINSIYHVKTYCQFIKFIMALDSDKEMYRKASKEAKSEARRLKLENEMALEKFIDMIK